MMNLNRSLPIAVLAGSALCLLPTAAASAKVVDCATWVKKPNTQISSARGMTCTAAATVMKQYRGDISPVFLTGGFRCAQVSGGQFSGQWRCVKGAKAFRFEFKD